MYLRELKKKDARLMLSWMHDCRVTEFLRTDFSKKALEDAEQFIESSHNDAKSIHFAIASDNDEYMGTVSLKHIEDGNAEFAITVRSEAMGRGFSWFGMRRIISYAFNNLNLNYVYWCVSKTNKRAVRFYDKHCYQEASFIPQVALTNYDGNDNLKWYGIHKVEMGYNKETVAGCRVVQIRTLETQGSGKLSFFEANRDVAFDIKRIYYISNVPEGVTRGFHAHKDLKQLLFCPYGSIMLSLENKTGRDEIELSDPSVGIIIDSCTWREMLWFRSDSILCVAASNYYDENDYIRDYGEFRLFLSGKN